MHATPVHIEVKPEHGEDFLRATRENHRHSIREPGNLRFDILQLAQDPTRFVCYEAYAMAGDAARHKQAAHYLKWRDAVAEWVAHPRQGIRYHGRYPEAGP